VLNLKTAKAIGLTVAPTPMSGPEAMRWHVRCWRKLTLRAQPVSSRFDPSPTPNNRTVERHEAAAETVAAIGEVIPDAFAGDAHAFLVPRTVTRNGVRLGDRYT
jgi:hypothetical protein